MSSNPHQVSRDFERAIAEYTGAPYVVAVNSCTAALTLAVAWHLKYRRPMQGDLTGKPDRLRTSTEIEIPKRTYISVPMAIIHAGGKPVFRDESWIGSYQLKPLPVWDSARHFSSDMYYRPKHGGRMIHQRGDMVCLSFHASKTLGIEQGGAILHDNPEADIWFRKARFDGRTEGVAPKDDQFDMIGWHAYMNPSTAAQGLLKLHSLPKHNEPLPNDDYPDLSKLEIFN